MVGSVRTAVRISCIFIAVSALISAGRWTLYADELTLKSGMRLRGRHAPLKEVGGNALAIRATAGEVGLKLIRVIDDGLRRIFVSSYQIDTVSTETQQLHGIKIPQLFIARSGRSISSVGQILGAAPFDKWGRRTIRLRTPRGQIAVIQGITEINPLFTTVEGLIAGRSYVWDMRMATSSIPQTTLSSVLLSALDRNNANDRLSIVRLYIQAQRYEDAVIELQHAIRDFPELQHLRRQERELRQLSARRLVGELKLRRRAGHHERVRSLLANFPSDDVAQDILLEVDELANQFADSSSQIQRVNSLLDQFVSELGDEQLRRRVNLPCEEIATELNLNNLNRMADFLRLADDPDLDAEQKLSLAISGWIMGSGAGVENLAISLSLVEVRNLVRQYLRTSQADQTTRAEIIEKLTGLEGSDPASVAKILRSMKPPSPPLSTADDGEATGQNRSQGHESAEDTDQIAEPSIPGLYQLRAPGLPGDADIEYLVQLPPEYDPYRIYPTIVTLHAAGTSPTMQIDWWAGNYSKPSKMRIGQAGRHGYIVVAPRWSGSTQRTYGYSAREHAAVLFSLRDACQKFSIDTDRVFLSGHSMGGDAAWDIGLAHPDVWAGVIPIVAVAVREGDRSPQYISRYADNAKHVPLYFVHGEKDGNKVVANALQYNRYLQRAGYDAMVVEYIGRGHEHFLDEIHRLFEWMQLHQRDRTPNLNTLSARQGNTISEFKCASMRPWDSFFWWAELEGLPGRSMVMPLEWPQPKSRPVEIVGRIRANNSIWLRSGASRTVVWMTPEIVDFSRRVSIDVDGRKSRTSITPSTEVMLEDARTRADRLHPFWAKLEVQGRRR